MGIKILSKNIKNNIKSSAVNAKTKKNSNNIKYKIKYFLCIKSCFHAVNKQRGTVKVVNNKKKIDIPSTPNEHSKFAK